MGSAGVLPHACNSIQLARRRTWLEFRRDIQGVGEAVAADDEREEPAESPAQDEMPWAEDSVDCWRTSQQPHRELSFPWVGFTECEKLRG